MSDAESSPAKDPADSSAPSAPTENSTPTESSTPGDPDSTAAAAAAETPPPVDPRPRPAYGEYAPEGWEWKPETDDAQTVGAPTPPASGTTPTASAPRPSAGQVPGVPHNLGVKGAPNSSAPSPSIPTSTSTSTPNTSGSTGSTAGRASNASGDPAPYRADAPQPLAPAQARAARTAAAAGVGAAAPKDRRGDRIITVILLVLGGIGALYNALSLMQLPASLELILTSMESDATIPGWVGTMSTISAIAMLALYAVTLIYSLQRLRARKLTFFVPLSAGAIALLIVIVVSMIAMFGVPEMVQLSQDPDAVNRMMQSLLETGS